MHRLMAGITILEHELSELRLLVERQTGILLNCPNSILAAHVAGYVEKCELESVAALLNRMRSSELDPTELAAFLDGVLNVNTGFFRHPGAMSALSRQVIPQIYARKAVEGSGTLRIWSAGCGTGEETYSIAMAITDAMPGTNPGSNGSQPNNGNPGKDPKSASRSGGISENSVPNSSGSGLKDWSIHIVGSDLLPSALAVAERGLYPQSALAGLPPALIRASFSKVGTCGGAPSPAPETLPGSSSENATSSCGNGTNGVTYLLVKPRIRSLVTFNTMNLTKPVYIGRFDCIFCMDVLPHLSRAQRSALIERMHLYLEPGGYLFLSQTEKLCTANLNFRSETYDGYTFHRKPLAASAAYGR
jgi:chemotaxis methyl-accepting protein methylase